MEAVLEAGDEMEVFVYEELYFTKTLQDQVDYLNETRIEKLEELYWKWNLQTGNDIPTDPYGNPDYSDY